MTESIILTKAKYWGSAPSRDHAHVRREIDATLARLTERQMTRSPKIMTVVAPFEFVACWMTSIIGKVEFRAFSREPMVKRMTITMT